jgi:hypothetical protein
LTLDIEAGIKTTSIMAVPAIMFNDNGASNKVSPNSLIQIKLLPYDFIAIKIKY